MYLIMYAYGCIIYIRISGFDEKKHIRPEAMSIQDWSRGSLEGTYGNAADLPAFMAIIAVYFQ